MNKTAFLVAIIAASISVGCTKVDSDNVMAHYNQALDSNLCADLAEAARNIAKMRDNGVSREGVTSATKRFQPHLTEDYTFNYVVDHVYASDDTPDAAHRRFLRDCAARL